MTAKPAHRTGNLGSDSRLNLAGAVVSQGATFAVVLLIARAEGQSVLGLYAVVFAMRALLVLACGLGMRIALTRFVAAAGARQDYAQLRGSVRLGVALPVGVAGVAAVALYAAAPWLAEHLFGQGDTFVDALRLGALSLPFAVLMDVSLAASQGFQTMKTYAGVGLIGEPLLRLTLTALALHAGMGLEGAAGALLASSFLAGMSAVVLLGRMMRRLPSREVAVPTKALLGFSGVSWVASLATQGILWSDVIILGALATAQEVGLYQVASRVVLTAMFVITPLTTSMAPRIAHYWESGEVGILSHHYATIVLWTWRLSLPLLLALLVVPEAALHLFGSSFSTGVGVVFILAAGALVESAAAPSAVLLNQVGRNKLNMVINLSSLGGNIGLNLLLIPLMGMYGAAIAWALALVVPGVVRVVAVRRLVTHEWPFTGRHAAAAAAAAGGAAVAALVVFATALPWWGDVGVVGVTMTLTYTALLVAVGLSASERAALRRTWVLAYRQVGTTAPALRRWMSRWRFKSAERGTAPLEIEKLISPFRLDILARADLFRLARAHRDLLDHDVEAFLTLAESSQYAVWFEEVMLDSLQLRAAPESARKLAFRQNVVRSLHLLRSFEARGFDLDHPLTVARLPAGVELRGWTLAEDRLVPVDGCHRLALLYEAGQTHVQPGQYAEAPLRLARNHTPLMLRALKIERSSVMRFLAAGLVPRERRHGVSSFHELLEQLEEPRNREHVARWPEIVEVGPDLWHREGEEVPTHREEAPEELSTPTPQAPS